MRATARRLVLIGATVVIGAAGTVTAWASWSTPGTATVKARVAKMPRGVQPSVARRGATAVVSWSSQELAPGADMTAYVITAHSVTPPKTAVSHTVTATGTDSHSITFTANELAGGRWQWTLTPKFHSWTGAESPPTAPVDFPAPSAAGSLVAQAEDPAAPPPSTSTPTSSVKSPSTSMPTEPKPAAEPDQATPTPADEPKKTGNPTKEPDPATPSPLASSSSLAGPDDELVDK